MALALTLSLGERIFVGKHWIRLLRILSARLVEIDTSDGDRLVIDDQKEIEAFPDVWIGLGNRAARLNARLSIAAPRELVIVRPRRGPQ